MPVIHEKSSGICYMARVDQSRFDPIWDAVTSPPERLTVLCGGVGGARFLHGVLHLVRRSGASTEVTAVVNTADDLWLHGLKVCPDLDTVMYTLGGGIDTERGWGRQDESWRGEEGAGGGWGGAPRVGLGGPGTPPPPPPPP